MRGRVAACLLVLSSACSPPPGAASPGYVDPPDASRPTENEASVVTLSIEVEVPEARASDEPLLDNPKTPDPTTGEPTKPITTDSPKQSRPSPPPPPPKLITPPLSEDSLAQPGDPDDGQRPPKNKVAAAAVRSAQGELDPAEVQKAVESAIETFRPCLRTDTVVVLDAKVTPEGDVTEARAISSRPEDIVVRDCVAFAFRKLHFGVTGAASASTFRLSLSLKRRS